MSVTLMFTVAVLNKPPESSAFISYDEERKDVNQTRLCEMEREYRENCLRSRVGNRTAVLERPTHHRPDHRTTENQTTKLGDSKIVNIAEIVQQNGRRGKRCNYEVAKKKRKKERKKISSASFVTRTPYKTNVGLQIVRRAVKCNKTIGNERDTGIAALLTMIEITNREIFTKDRSKMNFKSSRIIGGPRCKPDQLSAKCLVCEKVARRFDSMYLVGRYGPVCTGSYTYSLEPAISR